MGGSVFNASVIIRAVDQASRVIERVAHTADAAQNKLKHLDTTQFKNLAGNMQHVEKNAKNMSRQLKENARDVEHLSKKMELMNGLKNIGIGLVNGAVGAGLLKELDELAQKAGDVQMQLIQLGGVYGLDIDDSKLKEIEQKAQELSQKTLFSQKENLGITLELAHAGISQKAIQSVMEESTYLAEIEVGMGKSSSAQRSAYNFARMAEDAGITGDVKRMQQFADDMHRVINVTHADSESLGESFKYSMPVVKNLGWTEQDNLLATAMAARSGMEGSMAGTHIKDFAQRLNPIKALKSNNQKVLAAMADAGFIGDVEIYQPLTKAGKPKGNPKIVGFKEADLIQDEDHIKSYADLVKILHEKHKAFIEKGQKTNYAAQLSAEELKSIQDTAQTGKQLTGGDLEWAALMHRIFGEQGQDFAIVSTHIEMFEKLQEQMEQQKSLHEQIDAIRESFVGQMHVVSAKFETIGLQLGKPVMEAMVPVLKLLSDELGKLIAWFDQHPKMAKFIAMTAAVIGIIAVLGGIVMTTVGIFGVMSLGLKFAGLSFLSVAASAGGFLLAAAAVAGIAYLVYRNWDTVKNLWSEYGWVVKGVAAIFLLAYTPAILVTIARMLQLGIVTAATTAKTIALRAWTAASAFVMGAYRSILLAVSLAKWMYAVSTGAATIATRGQMIAVMLLAPWIAAVRVAVMAWTGVQWLLNAALAANPIGAVIMIIVALVAVVILAIYYWEDWWNWLKKFASNLPGWAVIVLDVFMPIIGIPLTIAKYWDTAIAKVKEFLGLNSDATETANNPPSLVERDLEKSKPPPNTPKLVEQYMPDVKLPIGVELDQEQANQQMKLAEQYFSGQKLDIPLDFKEGDIVKLLNGAGTSPGKELPSIPISAELKEENLVKQLNDMSKYGGHSIPLFADLKNSDVTKQINAMNNQLTMPKNTEVVAKLNWEDVKKQTPLLQQHMNTAGKNSGVFFASGLGSTSPIISAAISGIRALFSSTLPSVDWMRAYGENLGNSFAQGLASTQAAIQQAAQNVANTVHANLAVNSPTKEGPLAVDQSKWGRNLIRSIAGGMLSNKSILQKASLSTAGTISSQLSDIKGATTSYENNLSSIEQTTTNQHGRRMTAMQPTRTDINLTIGDMHFHGSDPKENALQFHKVLKNFAKNELPRHIDNHARKQNRNNASYRIGLQT
jgi:TP901 family phage tail tape measure protein